MYKKPTFLLLLILFVTNIIAQNYTISGFIKDIKTGEIIIGASVFDNNSLKGTSTNSYGFYSLTLSGKDSLLLVGSFVGYEKYTKKIILSNDTILDIFLSSNTEIDNVLVQGNSSILKATSSTVEIPVRTAKLLPSMGGEIDIIKSLQLMPGVQSAGEGSSQLIIRGGSPDQNLVLLDEVPLYYTNHLGGFISAFNPYSIKKVEIIKGGFPAQYGGRLSSIIDIRTKDGNKKKFGGEYNIGILSAKLTLEGPIIKDKFSFIFSARKGLLDLYSNIYLKTLPESNQNAGYNFYDSNLKFHYIISKKSNLYFGFYTTSDIININYKEQKNGLKTVNKFGTGWQNTVSNVKWNYNLSNKLFMNLTVAHSFYSYFNNIKNTAQSLSDTVADYINSEGDLRFKSNINDIILKANFNYNLNYSNNIKFGINILPHLFQPGVSKYHILNKDEIYLDTIYKSNNINTVEASFYVSNYFKIADKIKGNIGIYNAVYFTNNKKYFSFEPRLMLSYSLNNNISLKTSFVKMRQFIHLLSTAGIGTPADFWVPVTDEIPPQNSYQFTLGTDIYLRNKSIYINTEFFYKQLSNLIELKEGETLLWVTYDWQNTVEKNGIGNVYGIEFLVQKKTGKLTGWLAYTWSKNTRQFEEQNLGKPYPYLYDRTHNFSATAIYELKNITFSANWVYQTGNAITLAYGKHETITSTQELPASHSGGYSFYFFDEVYMFTEKNSFRMPATHHLSIGVNFIKEKKRGTRTWSLNVYNVYNQKNPYMLFYQSTRQFGVELKKMTLFPIIPSISYSFKF